MATHPAFSQDWVCRHGHLCPTMTIRLICLLLPLCIYEEDTEKEENEGEKANGEPKGGPSSGNGC